MMKRCVVCESAFSPRGKQKTCSPDCSATHRNNRIRKWNAQHKDRARARSKRHYDKFTAQRRESSRRWRLNNPDKAREVRRTSRAKNAEKYKITTQRWRNANKDRVRITTQKWQANNIEKRRRSAARHSAKRTAALRLLRQLDTNPMGVLAS